MAPRSNQGMWPFRGRKLPAVGRPVPGGGLWRHALKPVQWKPLLRESSAVGFRPDGWAFRFHVVGHR